MAVLVYPGFSEFEVTVALTLLNRRYQVVNVGLSREPVRGEGGLLVQPERSLDDVRSEEFAAILVPGAADMAVLADQPALSALLRGAHARGALLGAVCGGPFALGQAGVLDGVPYTVTFTAEQRAVLGVFPEGTFEFRDVVRSENVITAQGHAFVEFGLAVAEALGAVVNVEGARTFYRGHGNPALNAQIMTS
ncbi:DJ-1/PfpI family protein [Deinococcus yavapaiensis KR-236]|uniref:DJ-1/PfpI family protein n=1 Tax=Deinococcus yavapaiensis KR-236 TaxID=694435 RepID=A0A318SAY0_9DEIO|nr:DJ-1/PfpI family protein [Deinococcus yavapaiensis KR-236]